MIVNTYPHLLVKENKNITKHFVFCPKTLNNIQRIFVKDDIS